VLSLIYASLGLLLPWLLVAWLRDSALPLFYVLLAFLGAGTGLSVLSGFSGKKTLSATQTFMLAPSVGLIVLCAASFLFASFDITAVVLLPAILVTAGLGWKIQWKHLSSISLSRVSVLKWFLISTAFTVCFALPMVWLDGCPRPGNIYSWIHVDSVFWHSISAVCKAVQPPVVPGFSSGTLNYHYGPPALAGLVSRFAALELSDSILLLRLYGLFSLMLSTVVLGRAYAERIGFYPNAGILAGLGLFFAGTPISLFRALADTVPSVVLFSAAGVVACVFCLLFFLNRGNGWWKTGLILAFAIGLYAAAVLYFPSLSCLMPPLRGFENCLKHFYYGYSILWGLQGLIVIFCILTLTLGTKKRVVPWLLLCVVAALSFPSNIFAGVIAFGTVCGTFLLYKTANKSWRDYVYFLGAAIVSFVLVWRIGVFKTNVAEIGVDGGSGAIMETAIWLGWCWLVSGLLFVPMGRFRLQKFRELWVLPYLILCLICIVFAVWQGNTATLSGGSEALYFLYFCSHIFVAVAFVEYGRLLYGWRKRKPDLIQEEIDVMAKGAILVSLYMGIFLSGLLVLTMRSNGMGFSQRLFELGFVLFILLFCISIRRAKVEKFIPSAFIPLLTILFMGICLWSGGIRTYPLWSGRYCNTLNLTTQKALANIRDQLPSDALVAVNFHQDGHSYKYSACLERRILLEGWEYSVTYTKEELKNLRKDNRMIYSTSEGTVLEGVILKYGIHCIICKDGTDIGLRANPGWLIPMTNVQPLNAYMIDSEKLNRSILETEHE